QHRSGVSVLRIPRPLRAGSPDPEVAESLRLPGGHQLLSRRIRRLRQAEGLLQPGAAPESLDTHAPRARPHATAADAAFLRSGSGLAPVLPSSGHLQAAFHSAFGAQHTPAARWPSVFDQPFHGAPGTGAGPAEDTLGTHIRPAYRYLRL